MMVGTARLRYLRMTPRKVEYVIRPLRRKTVAQALASLGETSRKAARPVAKLVASAFANARQRDPALREEDVVIRRAVADEGPTGKRFRAAAFGRATRIMKRTTHVTVELEKR